MSGGPAGILDSEVALSHFFRGLREGRKIGFPHYTAKWRSAPAFHLTGPFRLTVHVESGRVKLPRSGWVRGAEDPTKRLFLSKITSAVISYCAGRWSIAFAVARCIRTPLVSQASREHFGGIDLGIGCFAVCTDGQRFVAPEPLDHALDQVRTLSRSVSRKRNVRDGVVSGRMQRRTAHLDHQAGLPHWPSKADRKIQKARGKVERAARAASLASLQAPAHAAGLPIPAKLPREQPPIEQKSHRQDETEQQLARLHRTVANRRANFLHEQTTRLAHRGGTLVIEDLAVGNLVRNHRLARRIVDQGWGEFRRQLAYKCTWYGTRLVVANRFYPSSKTCSRCDEVKAGRLTT